MVVGGGQLQALLFGEGLAVEAALQDRRDALVAAGVQTQRPRTGSRQAVVTVTLAQAQDPQTGAEALLGMRTVGHEVADDPGGGRSGLFGPAHQAFRGPLGVRAMGLGHVLGDGGVAALQRGAHMAGDALALVAAFDRMLGEAHVQGLLHQGVGHRVVVTVDLDVIVDVDPHPLPGGVDVRGQGQRAQCRTIDRLEGLASRTGQFPEGPLIEPFQQGGDGRVQLAQAEEGLVTQGRQDPALDDLHPGLRLGLIPRFAHPRRHHGHAVVVGQLQIGGIEIRLVAMRLAHAAAQIVRDQQGRHPLEVGEGPYLRADPVGQTLRPGRLGIGVVRGPEHRHEDRRGAELPAGRIHDRHRLPGIVDEQLLPSTVGLAHHHVERAAPVFVALAEPAVAEALGVLRPVLLPQQHQRHTGTAQLVMHHRPVRHHAGVGRHRRWRRKQPPLQLPIAQGVGQGPTQPRGGKPPRVLPNAAARHLQARRDLPSRQADLEPQAQILTNLTHGQPLHLDPSLRKKGRS